MSFLYQSGIAIYTLLIRFAALFNSKARAWVQGRKGWKQELEEAFGENDNVAWFHAASLGEFEQGRPVMEAFGKKYPEYKILLTFFSPSGYLQKKHYEGADKVMYLPPDCRGNAKYLVEKLNPDIAIFIKYGFGTSTVEYMTVVSGELTVKLPGEDEWKNYAPFETFIV